MGRVIVNTPPAVIGDMANRASCVGIRGRIRPDGESEGYG